MSIAGTALSRASSVPALLSRLSSSSSLSLSAMKHFPQPFQPSRPISTVIQPMSGSGKFPGHVQFQTTPKEQADFDLAPAYGHSPAKDKPKTPAHESGTLSDGTAFHVKGIKTEAKPLDKDDVRPITDGSLVHDHGELSKEEAEILKSQTGKKEFETSGKLQANCVHGYKQMVEALTKTKIDIHDHALPQDMLEIAKTFKAGGKTD